MRDDHAAGSESAGSESPRWVFDASPPSGTRRGGDPSEFAFPRTLDSFVREALQNANDQSLHLGSARAEVRFDLEELRGRDLKQFLDALGWDTLRRHLQAASKLRSISKFQTFAEKDYAPDQLMLLRVEDRYTSGLVGDEHTGDSNFRALCRDSLFSHKQNDSAGGSYGLGKSVYWAFSALSTVMFHSCLSDGSERHRLIGRVELPSHELGGESLWGPGWFGRCEETRKGQRAVSLWDASARELARRLRIERPPRMAGTTILVVGFRDPTSEGQDDVAAVLERIRIAAARFFWPAMHFPRPLRVLVGGQPIQIFEEVAPFVTAWQGRTRAGARLEKPGDIAHRSLSMQLPRLKKEKEQAKQNVQCELLVRLAEPLKTSGSNNLDNTVAMFRGAGMVVRYLPIDLRSLPRFHAVLACGIGRAPEAPDPSDEYAETFLRTCEPPGHDDWHSTPRLKDEYIQGGVARLNQLFNEVRDTIREILLAPISDAERGPELLQRRYPLGGVGDPKATSSASAFRFGGLEAVFEDGRWRFAGTVEPATRGHAWSAEVTLKMLGDDGAEVGRLRIAGLKLNDAKRGKVELGEEGTAILIAGRNVEGLAFSGVSEPLLDRDRLCELALEITGELRPKGNA